MTGKNNVFDYDGREEGSFMYKDVWKKFGAKVLIVLCSVLLLGGVAIAAPRLKAVSTPGPVSIASCSAIRVNGTITYQEDGKTPLPSSLIVTVDGNEIPVGAGDFKIRSKGNDQAAAKFDDDTAAPWIEIEGVAGSKLLPAYDDKGIMLTKRLNYTIEKKVVKDGCFTYEMKDAAAVTERKNPLVVTSLPTNITSGDFTVYYENKDENIEQRKLTEGTDYTLKDTVISNMGPGQSFSIELENYKISGQSGTDESKRKFTCRVVKNVGQLDVLINGYRWNDYRPQADDEEITVTVYDGGVTYDNAGKANIDVSAKKLEANVDYRIEHQAEKQKYVISASDDGNYIGTRDVTYAKKGVQFNLFCTGYDMAKDYDKDLGGTYECKPESVVNRVYEDDNIRYKDVPMVEGTDYEIAGYSVEGGGTAGTVTVTFRGLGKYLGLESEETYQVKRKLDPETVAAIQLQAVNEGDKFIYDRTPHKMTPLVTMKGSEHQLKETTDFSVSYVLEPENDNIQVQKPEDNYTCAGTVFVTITGNIQANDNQGGYYGTMDGQNYNSAGNFCFDGLSYQIQRRDIRDGYAIELRQTNYNLTFSQPPVEEKAFLVALASNPTTMKIPVKDLGESYTVSFEDASGNKVTKWSSATSGKYYIVFTFHGNFKESVKAEFNLLDIDPDQVTVNVQGTCTGDASKDSAHVYTGEPHEPTVTASYNGNPLSDFELSYSRDGVTYSKDPAVNNVNAGRVYVKLTLSGGLEVAGENIYFDIAPRSLSDGTLRLSSDDEFTKGITVTHEYSGRVSAPKVTKLVLEIQDNDGNVEKEIPMAAGTDFTLADGLYTKGNTAKVNLENLVLKSNYCFKLSGTGDNFSIPSGTRIDTEEFQFTPRPITSSEIKFSIDPIAYDGTVLTADQYKTKIIEKLIITDDKFKNSSGVSSVLRKDGTAHADYTITVADSDIMINSTGVVQFTITGTGEGTGTGCYSGSTTYELQVGSDIVKATVREQNDKTHKSFDLQSRTLVLSESYTVVGDAYSLQFNETITYDNKKVNLYYMISGTNKMIPCGGEDVPCTNKDKKYLIDWGGTDFKNGQQYGTVTLQGINGYFGKVDIEFPIEKVDLNKKGYFITFLGEDFKHNDTSAYTYTGDPIEPDIQVWAPTENPAVDRCQLEEGVDYKIVQYDREIEANEQYWNENEKTSRWSYVEIEGQRGYEGKIKGYYKIGKRDISMPETQDPNSKRIMASEFELEGFEDPIPYRPRTETSVEGEHQGAWQDVKLGFKPKSTSPLKHLTGGTDYSYVCENTTSAGKATLRVTAKGNNFKGEFEQEYTISPVLLSKDCTVTLADGNNWLPFTGKRIEPEITVKQVVGEKEYSLTKGTDYEVEYRNALFVSKSSDLTSTNATYVIVKPVANNPNYLDTVELPYVIHGNINANEATMAGYGYVQLDVNHGNDVILPYSDPMSYEKLNLTLQQREDGTDSGQDYQYGDKNGHSSEYRMEWNTDYTVSCSDETIGFHSATVYGTGNKENMGVITGEKRIPITIQANLRSDVDEDVLWQKNGGSNNISSEETLTAESLSKILTVQCGGRSLTWGEDYIFANDVNPSLGGPHYITIKPTDKANQNGKNEADKGYLVGKLDIPYYVSSDIQGKAKITKLEKQYIYAHGQAVIDPLTDDFGVIINGKELKNRRDYEVTVTRKGEVFDEPKDCGTYNFTITGINDYSGVVSTTFEIIPYDFNADYAQGKVFISLESETVTYTGKTQLPTVKEVTVKSGGSFVLKSLQEDGTGDYSVKAGSQGDHTNWTDTEHGDKAPTIVVYGQNNYIGEVTAEYLITQKSISDPDITSADIEGLFYQNGAAIKPYPELTYYEDAEQELIYKILKGIEYNPADASENKYGNSWKDYLKADFTYQYLNDVTSIGDKEIEIRGMGNFTGSRKISYTVSPLDLGVTKLNFLSESMPVYDGTPLEPAFELKYGDVVVLTYMNGTVQSEHGLSNANVSVVFGNNINATTEESRATIRIETSGTNSNYTGYLDGYFTISPASLKDHVKFMYHLKGQKDNTDLRGYKLNLPWVNTETTVQPVFARGIVSESDIEEEQLGIFYDFAGKANHNKFLELEGQRGEAPTGDYTISYKYVEPDSEDVDVREGYGNEHQPPCSYAGKVKVTLTGMGNYADSASFWYYIGTDISSVGTAKLKTNTTVFNSQIQTPTLILSGITEDECTIAFYKNEAVLENLITKDDFVHAGTYFVRIEGKPWAGTYASKPQTFTYTITARPLSSAIVIDGFKKEYSYTGNPICPVGISVTDYIDKIKYRLTENVDYSLTYANNLNAGTAVITVVGQNDYSGSATAKFTITSSTISSGGANNGGSLTEGSGELSGTMAVKPEDVKLSMDTSDAMYYTGNQLRPGVSIAGMTENVDYTVTYSNNVEVGTGIVTIAGIKNNTGTITKMFRIIAPLSKCTVAPIPDQQHTGSPITPTVTIKCGNSILVEGTDYTVSYANNINIGTATVTIRSANNSNYTGSTTATFHIGNNIGAFIISGYAPSYTYTGKAITPGVVVESGNSRLTQGTDYTVSYANNTNAGTATITVTGIGKYSGTQTANFIIEGKNIETCDTTGVTDKTYTGDAYTPSITVSDNGTVLKNGVDYILTYVNNTNPGTASILVQGMSNNYVGTKIISFKIAGVPIKGLKAATIKYNSIKLSWTKQSYADGYQICDSKSKVVKNVTKNSATITKLSAGKTYKYKVRSYIRNSDGSRSYGAFSPVLSTTTKLKTPSVKITSTKKGQARISWSKVSGATGYEIYYKKSKGAKYKKLKTINKANVRICTVRGLKSGDRCYFRVRAFKKSGSKKVYSALNPLKVITIK